MRTLVHAHYYPFNTTHQRGCRFCRLLRTLFSNVGNLVQQAGPLSQLDFARQSHCVHDHMVTGRGLNRENASEERVHLNWDPDSSVSAPGFVSWDMAARASCWVASPMSTRCDNSSRAPNNESLGCLGGCSTSATSAPASSGSDLSELSSHDTDGAMCPP